MYQVFCNGSLVEFNGVSTVPTLDDAKVRVPFHLGMTIGDALRSGKTFPGRPFLDNFDEWPFEQRLGGLRIQVWDYVYEIREVRP